MIQDSRRALGAHGEELAASRLRRLGYTILARNFRTRYGEIDLIACDEQTLVFAEVKTRRISDGRRPIRADQEPLHGLGRRQRIRLRRLAAAWLAGGGHSRPYTEAIRFDAIGVVIDTRGRLLSIEHVEGAF